MSDTESRNLIWGLVHVGPMTFIGAFRDYDATPSFDQKKEEVEERVMRTIERNFENGKTITLEPVMEMQAPLQQVRQQAPDGERVGVAKSPLPMPYGFTTGQAKLRVLYPAAYTFINEMREGDQKVYRGFIETVFRAENEQRAARAGFVLPGPGGVLHG